MRTRGLQPFTRPGNFEGQGATISGPGVICDTNGLSLGAVCHSPQSDFNTCGSTPALDRS